MRLADERCSASAISSSSIRLSLVGEQVGWMMKMSWPRTFAFSSKYTSPSLNFETSARPRGTPRCLQTFWASSGFALPLNTIKLGMPFFLPAVAWTNLHGEFGWGGRIRTYACKDQNLVPYRLATPQWKAFPRAAQTCRA